MTMNAETLERDAAQSIPDDAGLAMVSDLAERQMRLEDEIEELGRELKAKNDELRRVQTDALPAAMAELNLSEIRMGNGSKVEIKSFIQASIPASRREEAFSWLRDHGHGALVKHEVKVVFGKEEDEIAQVAIDTLRERGFYPEDKESVHASTLKAWIREQIEAGAEIPLETFGAHLGQTVKITRSE